MRTALAAAPECLLQRERQEQLRLSRPTPDEQKLLDDLPLSSPNGVREGVRFGNPIECGCGNHQNAQRSKPEASGRPEMDQILALSNHLDTSSAASAALRRANFSFSRAVAIATGGLSQLWRAGSAR